MLIYVIVLSLSTIMAFFAQKFYERNRLLGVLCSVLTVLPLAIVSGLKNITVGYDFMFYCYDDFRRALFSPSYAYCISHSGNEMCYMTLVYIVSCFTNSPHWLMFTLTAVTMGFAFAACLRLNDKAPTFLTWAFFLLFGYVDSFNLIRQFLAVGACFYAFSCYKGRNGGWAFWLLGALAFEFHHSAVLAILVIFFANKLSAMPDGKRKRLLVLYTVGMVAAAAALVVVLKILADMFPFFEKYQTYASSKGNESWREAGMSKLSLLMMAVSLLTVWLHDRAKAYDSSTATIAYVMMLTNLMGLVLGNYTQSATRICLYFSPICYFYVLHFLHGAKKISDGTKVLFALAYMSFLVYTFVKNYSSPTQYLWYKSDILGL